MSPSSSSLTPTLQRLLAQFHTRYPMGCLISEFLTVHQGVYAVRAIAQIGNTLLATGMATAPELETAEDYAKVRALEALEMMKLPATPVQPASSWLTSALESNPPLIDPLPAVGRDSTSPIDSLPLSRAAIGQSNPSLGVTVSPTPATSSWSPPVAPLPTAPLPTAPLPTVAVQPDESGSFATPASANLTPTKTGGSVVADFYSHINADADEPLNRFDDFEQPSEGFSSKGDRSLEETMSPSSSATTPSKPRRKPNPSPDLSASTATSVDSASVDLSDVIAQTDVELARLGWNKTQGREHLKQTYGKRSRQELDEIELYDFLHYLQEQA